MSRLSVFPDLTPSDFKFKSSQQFKSPTANLGYYGAVIAFGILIAAIYSSRGVWETIAVCVYVISLTLMSVSIRNVYVRFSFNYPQFLVFMHSFSTATVGACILKHRQSTT